MAEYGRKARIILWPRLLTYLSLQVPGSFRDLLYNEGSRDNSVGITTGYGLDGRESILCRGKEFFSSPQRPDRL
jgi:hypothetical protein